MTKNSVLEVLKFRKTGKWAQAAIFMVLLIAASAVAYLPLLGHTFHSWDDDVYITSNQRVIQGLNGDNIKWAFTTTYFGFYYPLTWLSHMTDAQMHGMDPRGHYLTSLIIHSLNAALLFVFLLTATGAGFRSFVAASFFALHPMNVESVAWLAERKNILSAFFLLLALTFYVLRNKKGVSWKRSSFYYFASCVFFVMGLMSKSSIAVFPLLLLAIDIWPLERLSLKDFHTTKRELSGLLIEKIPFFILSAASAVITFTAQSSLRAIHPLNEIGPDARFATVFMGLWFYIRKLFAPVNLCVFYPHPRDGYHLIQVIMSLLLTLGITVLFFCLRRLYPALLAGWLFFAASLLPVIGILQVGAQGWADRYAYFSYWGLFTALVFGIRWEKIILRGRPWKLAIWALIMIVISLLFVATRYQLAKWKDDGTLWSNVIKVSPGASIGYFKLANHLKATASLEAAMPYYEQALERSDGRLEFYPDDGVKYFHKACIFLNMEQPEKAEEFLRLAEEKGYDTAEVADKTKAARIMVLDKLWNSSKQERRWDKAEASMREILRIDDERGDAWVCLAYALENQGRTGEAEAAYERGFSLGNTRDSAMYNLALIKLGKNDAVAARLLLDKLERMESPHAARLRALLEAKSSGDLVNASGQTDAPGTD